MNNPEVSPPEKPAPDGNPGGVPDGSSPPPVRLAGAHSSDALRVGDLQTKDVKESGATGKTRPKLSLFDAFLPNRALSAPMMGVIIAIEALLFLTLWITSPFKVLPQ